MSKIALSGNPSGTGTFTIAAPNSNNNRTLTLPDEAGTVLTSNTAIPQAQIATALNATGSAPIYACRAWVNFNGTTSPGTIRASGNVSSVTKSGTGIYVVNFTTAMPDANYAVNVTINSDSPVLARTHDTAVARTTSLVCVQSLSGSFSFADTNIFTVTIFR